MNQIDAYVLAGEGETMTHYSPLLEAAGVTNKAFISLGGRPMVYFAFDALNDAETIKSITIVGLTPDQVDFEFKKPVEYIEGGKTSFESIMAAINHFAREGDLNKWVLSMSCDTPLVTAEMIDRYLFAIDFSKDKDYYYPMVWKDRLDILYPHVSKMAFNFTDGKFYGGDIHLFKIGMIIRNQDTLQNILMNRKNFFKVARIISLRYIVLFLLNRLNINLAENWFLKRFGIKMAVAMFDFPESCADLDYEKDLAEFQRLCSQPLRKLDADEKVTFKSQYWDNN
ncbi:MAG: NTP transferase domain-containing protein [Candidatus Heimdallarchaeota archaeon]|nr:NTP transferase domain-containing protein [Candidatus Heimdallarchaeota archaeon]